MSSIGCLFVFPHILLRKIILIQYLYKNSSPSEMIENVAILWFVYNDTFSWLVVPEFACVYLYYSIRYLLLLVSYLPPSAQVSGNSIHQVSYANGRNQYFCLCFTLNLDHPLFVSYVIDHLSTMVFILLH